MKLVGDESVSNDAISTDARFLTDPNLGRLE